MSKEYYTNFKAFIADLTAKEKAIRTDLEAYKTAIGNNDNTIEIEGRLNTDLNNFKELIDQLTNAYSSRNAPENMPESTLDTRQKEIKGFMNQYEELKKDMNKLKDDKYSFKGQITEDYRNKEEYQNMNTQELIQVGKDKIAQQDEQLGEHIKMAKKGIVQVNEIKHELKEQKELINKEMDDMERVDSRMKKLTKRFEKYVANSSICCIMFVLILEAIIFGVLVYVFFKVKRGFKWD
jgi:chromosome segregation ATPase